MDEKQQLAFKEVMGTVITEQQHLLEISRLVFAMHDALVKCIPDQYLTHLRSAFFGLDDRVQKLKKDVDADSQKLATIYRDLFPDLKSPR